MTGSTPPRKRRFFSKGADQGSPRTRSTTRVNPSEAQPVPGRPRSKRRPAGVTSRSPWRSPRPWRAGAPPSSGRRPWTASARAERAPARDWRTSPTGSSTSPRVCPYGTSRPCGSSSRARARGARRQARGGRRQGHGDRRGRRRSRRDDARTARGAGRTGRGGHRRRRDRTEADRGTPRGLRRTTGRRPLPAQHRLPHLLVTGARHRGDQALHRERRAEQPREARTAPADHETHGAQPAEPDAVPGGRGRGRRDEPARHQKARRPYPGRPAQDPGALGRAARAPGAGAPARRPPRARAGARHARRPSPQGRRPR